jgi:hypothetical protein
MAEAGLAFIIIIRRTAAQRLRARGKNIKHKDTDTLLMSRGGCMTTGEWTEILEAGISSSGEPYVILFAPCDMNSMRCSARLQHGTTGATVDVQVERKDGSTGEILAADVLRQIRAAQSS